MKHLILIVTFPLAVLAYIAGSRLSDEAVLMLVGVGCGITTGIAIAVGLILALTRPPKEEPQAEPEPRNPVIIVVAPPRAGYLEEGEGTE